MKSHWIHSLRFHHILGNFVILFLLFGLLIINTDRVLKISALESLQTSVQQTSETLNLAIVPHTTAEGMATIKAYLDELISGNGEGIIYLVLFDDEDHRLVGTQDVPEPLPDLEIPLATQLESGVVHVGQPILLADNRTGHLRFGLSTRSILQTNERILRDNLLLLIGGLTLTIMILMVFGLQAGRQLGRLMHTSRAFGIGNYTVRAPEGGKNELHDLGHNFNLMADAVAERTETLLKSQIKYRLLAQNSPDMIFRMSLADDQYLYVSPAAKSIFGYSPDAWYDRPKLMNETIHPEWKHDFAKQWEDIKRGDPRRFYEYQIIHRDGSVRWLRQRNILERDENHDPVVVMGIVTDITVHKSLENKLHESDSRFQAIFAGTLDGILLADAQTRQFVDANPAICDMIGYNINELKTMCVADIHPPADLPRVMARFESQAGGGLIVAADLPVLRKDGSVFPADISVFRLDIDGRTCVAGFFRDISERKKVEAERTRLQRELLQSQKMEALGQLTGGIAHDFNNVLGIIRGYTELALEYCEDDRPDDLVEYLKRVKNAGDRAESLVSRMLLFSRNEDGDDKPHRLHILVEEEITMLRSVLPASIELDVQLAEDLPPVMMDPVRLNQLLMNLSVNARDAMNGKGRLAIALNWARELDTKCSICFSRVRGDWIELSVFDSGCGIRPDVQARMFEPFYTTKEAGKGSGLGMAVIHGIMKSYDGHVLMETEIGVGTCFRLLFKPLAGQDTEVRATERPADDRLQGNGEHILVLDDEPDLAELLEEILKAGGYRVTALTSSEQALELFKENPQEYALLITDQTMPVINGVELVKLLREMRPDIPVILNSGFSDEIEAGGLTGLDILFMGKPYTSEMMLKAVGGLLGGPRQSTD